MSRSTGSVIKRTGLGGWFVSCTAMLLMAWAALLYAPRAAAADDGITDYLTIPEGSYIVDMGAVSATYANSLRPYGLVYDLVRNLRVPVLWAINPDKVKDGIDFTNPHSGKNYRGSAFIIEGRWVNPVVLTRINQWKAQGVIIDGPITGDILNVPVYNAITGFANTVTDLANGGIAEKILGNAGMPSTLFRRASPSTLNACDDFYAMPHADPTWSTHRWLLDFTQGGGYIWAGCHAVSVLENVDNPATIGVNPDLNFLSTTGLINYKLHSDGSPPYVNTMPGDPAMQFIGITDGAHQGGSEQIFIPLAGGAWRPTTKVVVYDETQVNRTTTNPSLAAAAIVYGRAFGNPSYGQVMYEGGHDITKGPLPESIAAQRAFLNFWLLSSIDRSPISTITGASATEVNETAQVTFSASVDHFTPVSYQWISSAGGTFGSPNSATTTFTAPEVSADTVIEIRVIISDECGRGSFDVFLLEVKNLAKADLSIVKTESADPVEAGSAFNYLLSVRNLGTDTAENVVVTDTLPLGLLYNSAAGTDWTCNYDIASRTVTCTRATLPVSPTPSVITIGVQAPNTSTELSNTATVSGSLPDLVLGNNSSTTTTRILDGIDVAISKTAPGGPYFSGQAFNYTLNVQNLSLLQATSLTVTDQLPPSLTFVSASGSGWNCVYSNFDRVVTCFLAQLNPAPAASQITLRVIPTGVQGDEIRNTAVVTTPDFVDTDLTNNSSFVDITLSAEADVGVEKTGSTTGGNNTTQLDTYVVTVTNYGPGTAENIVVQDLMYSPNSNHINRYETTTWYNGGGCSVLAPVGTLSPTPVASTVAGRDPRWSVNTTTERLEGTWTISSLAPNTSATLTLNCAGDNNNGVLNTVTVTSSTLDTNPANNHANAFVADGTLVAHDVAVSKSVVTPASPTPIYVGDTITYRVELNKLLGGNMDRNGIQIIDDLPPGVTYVSAGDTSPALGSFSCSYNASLHQVTCSTNTNLRANTLAVLITVTAPSVPGPITNKASYFYDWNDNRYYDNNAANDIVYLTSQVLPLPAASTDIAVTKSANTTTPPLGGNVTFTVTAANTSLVSATNVRVTDVLPSGLSYLSHTQSVGTSYDPATGLWYVGSLGVGGSATLTITAQVGGSQISNTACLYTLDQLDTNVTNNCQTVILDPQYADLILEKTVDIDEPNVNSNVVFTVSVLNDGPSTMPSFTVQDVLPSGLEYVSSTASIGSYNSNSGLWTANAALLAGDTATLEITAKVMAAEVVLTNTAQITQTGVPDIDVSNNIDSAQVIGRQADIAVEKTVDIDTPPINTDLTFTVTVRNLGPSDATGIVIQDLLPPGLLWQSDVPSQGSYDPLTGLWTIGDLDVYDQTLETPIATLTLVARNTSLGLLTNTATLSAVDQYDPDATNDSAFVNIRSGGEADLEVTKQVDTPDTFQGDQVTFTVSLRNYGPDIATNVLISDPLPVGLTLVSATPSQGTYDPLTGLWDVGTVPLIPTELVLVIEAIVDAGEYTNAVTVFSLDQADEDPFNNTGIAVVNAVPAVDLAITKVGPSSAVLTETVQYVLTATNNGPGNVSGARIVDTVPAAITAVSWSCVATGNADCDTFAAGTGASGGGNAITLPSVSIDAGPGNFLTITVTGTASTTATITNTVIFSPPADNSVFDTNTANNIASVTTVISNLVLRGSVFADIGVGAGGIPNNGLRDGDEPGIASVTLTLSNCADTIYGTAVTDGDGNYTLGIPSTLAEGELLCVTQTNLTGYLSTGGSPGTTGGAYQLSSDRVQFTLVYDVVYNGVDFADVPVNRFLMDGVRSAIPGSTVSYSHSFVAGSGGQVTFSTNGTGNPDSPEWSEVIYLDANCDGELQPADTPLQGAVTVTADETVCLIVQVFVPLAIPPGGSRLTLVQAMFNYTNASPMLVTSYTRQDLTTVSDAALSITKRVRNVTQGETDWLLTNQAREGDVLEYLITFENVGAEPLNNLVIYDTTPLFTRFISAECVTPLPQGISNCTVVAPAPLGTGPIEWDFLGNLNSALSGEVKFQVQLE